MHEPISASLRTIIADTIDPPVRHVLHRDYETRGRLLLKRVGTHRYAADPGHRGSLRCFAIDNEPLQLWIPGESSAASVNRSGQQIGAVDRVRAQ